MSHLMTHYPIGDCPKPVVDRVFLLELSILGGVARHRGAGGGRQP